jgi:hypothetical protein
MLRFHILKRVFRTVISRPPKAREPRRAAPQALLPTPDEAAAAPTAVRALRAVGAHRRDHRPGGRSDMATSQRMPVRAAAAAGPQGEALLVGGSGDGSNGVAAPASDASDSQLRRFPSCWRRFVAVPPPWAGIWPARPRQQASCPACSRACSRVSPPAPSSPTP